MWCVICKCDAPDNKLYPIWSNETSQTNFDNFKEKSKSVTEVIGKSGSMHVHMTVTLYRQYRYTNKHESKDKNRWSYWHNIKFKLTNVVVFMNK